VSLMNVTMAQNSSNDFAGGLFSPRAGDVHPELHLHGEHRARQRGLPATQTNSSFSGGANVQAPIGGSGNKPASASGDDIRRET